jgi:hypothetical protein
MKNFSSLPLIHPSQAQTYPHHRISQIPSVCALTLE